MTNLVMIGKMGHDADSVAWRTLRSSLMTHVAQHHGRIHTASEAAIATRLPAPTVAKVLARLCRAKAC